MATQPSRERLRTVAGVVVALAAIDWVLVALAPHRAHSLVQALLMTALAGLFAYRSASRDRG